jgi:hypothetical protein
LKAADAKKLYLPAIIKAAIKMCGALRSRVGEGIPKVRKSVVSLPIAENGTSTGSGISISLRKNSSHRMHAPVYGPKRKNAPHSVVDSELLKSSKLALAFTGAVAATARPRASAVLAVSLRLVVPAVKVRNRYEISG